MSEFVVYPNAPVVLVALEVRHTLANKLTPTESRAIKRLLGDALPIELSGQMTNIEIIPGASGATSTTERFPRYFNRDTTTAVSFKQEAMVVETSAYPGWEGFLALALAAFQARQDIAPVDGINRIGLRYIDEVRVPDDPGDWSEWVHSSLLGPKPRGSVGLRLQQWQSIAVYDNGDDKALAFRYGPREGYAVEPASDLVRIKPTDGGLYFLMDIDSFWTRTGAIPPFDHDMLQTTCDDLHAPVRKLFEDMITDRLREEVLSD